MERIKLYIDKENIKSIVQSKDKDLFDDCMKLIRKNIDIHYNFSKEEFAKDPYMQLWFRCVTGQGVENKYKYSNRKDEVIPPRPLSGYDYLPNHFGIYLINDKDACTEIERHNCVLISEVGKELDTLKELLDINESEEVFAKDVVWKNYCPNIPLTDILLCDNYYFSDLNVYQRNNNELIRVLASVPDDFPVNVVIITRAKEISTQIDVRYELKKMQDMVQQASKNEESAVTIVGIREEIHDRVLITNYYRINSTAGFQRHPRIKNDIRFEIKSHAKGSNYDTSWKLIDESYQRVMRNPVFCIGDKRSNYIDFDYI
jgi:hypothetical protein